MLRHRRPTSLIACAAVLLLGLMTGCGRSSRDEPLDPLGFDPGSGVITGLVWEDLCELLPDGSLSGGCLQTGSETPRGNGIPDPVDPGLESIRVALWAGPCPGTSILSERATDAQGVYRFEQLRAGTYCVTIDPAAQYIENRLAQGTWTFPELVPDAAVASVTVSLAAGETASGVSFGFDRIGEEAPSELWH